MSLPVSSHDMLKSTKTARVLDVMMEGETTFLWIPIMKSKTEKKEKKRKLMKILITTQTKILITT